MRRLSGLSVALICLAVGGVGCGARSRAQVPAAVPTAEATPPALAGVPAPPVDPVDAAIASADQHMAAGEAQLAIGHLAQARTAFDLALEVLLEVPGGARTDDRLRDHFDRLVERISAYEVTALAAGDGFTETRYEAASIDELLETSLFEPVGADLALAVEADLASTAHDVPIPLNDRVLAYVQLFQGRLRDWFEAGLNRGTQYMPMIHGVFRAEGLPLDLAYVALIESAFKPQALSRAKAKGVWQFMRGTAIENGLKHDWYIDERADPEKATVAAARYLKTLHRMFDGDWHLALASYNGGPGRVQRALKASGASDFWQLSRSTRHLPRETREYVPMILAAAIIGRNPTLYGFDVVPLDPIAYEKVAVPRAIDLRRVAEWTGTSIDAVQQLNPELRRLTTPARYPDYEVKVPVGTGDLLRARLETAAPQEFTAFNYHTVKRGETLVSVANRFKVSRSALAEANGLVRTARLRVGQELLIPRGPAPAVAARTTNRPAPARAASASSARAPLDGDGGQIVYEVRRGDTLFGIARLFETTVDAIKRWNQLRTNRIVPGDRLTIYGSRTSALQ